MQQTADYRVLLSQRVSASRSVYNILVEVSGDLLSGSRGIIITRIKMFLNLTFVALSMLSKNVQQTLLGKPCISEEVWSCP